MLKLQLQYFGNLIQRTAPWKRLWSWERLKAGGEGDDREWDGWMAWPTRRTGVRASSRSWWWAGKPGVLQSMGSESQKWLSDWMEVNWDPPPQLLGLWHIMWLLVSTLLSGEKTKAMALLTVHLTKTYTAEQLCRRRKPSFFEDKCRSDTLCPRGSSSSIIVVNTRIVILKTFLSMYGGYNVL